MLGLALLLGVSAAVATTDGTTGSLTKERATYYKSYRHITASGSNIYVKKTDGPAINLWWYKKGETWVSGANIYFQSADPVGPISLGTNFRPDSWFGLAAYDFGSNGTDTWSGYVYYNAYSLPR